MSVITVRCGRTSNAPCGRSVSNPSVSFRSGNRLFMVMETRDDFDWERDFARYLESTSQAREWDALMHGYQQVVPAAQPGEWWSVMKEVYNLNDQLARLDATPPGKSP